VRRWREYIYDVWQRFYPEYSSGVIPSEEASILGEFDYIRDSIEVDPDLTEEQKLYLSEILDARKKVILAWAQSKGSSNKPEKCKEDQERYKEEVANETSPILLDCLTRALKYESDLTEAQKLDLYKLIDERKKEIMKIDEEVINADSDRKKDRDAENVGGIKAVIGILGFAILCILCVKLYFILPSDWQWYSKVGISLAVLLIWPVLFLISSKRSRREKGDRSQEPEFRRK